MEALKVKVHLNLYAVYACQNDHRDVAVVLAEHFIGLLCRADTVARGLVAMVFRLRARLPQRRR